MLILDASGKEIARRCCLHYATRCTDLDCVADEIDYRTNTARRRPKATPGAPEVSWGTRGVIHSGHKPPTTKAKKMPPPRGIMLRDPGRIPGGVGAPRPASGLLQATILTR